jgi:hypothetical protein
MVQRSAAYRFKFFQMAKIGIRVKGGIQVANIGTKSGQSTETKETLTYGSAL